MSIKEGEENKYLFTKTEWICILVILITFTVIVFCNKGEKKNPPVIENVSSQLEPKERVRVVEKVVYRDVLVEKPTTRPMIQTLTADAPEFSIDPEVARRYMQATGYEASEWKSLKTSVSNTTGTKEVSK